MIKKCLLFGSHVFILVLNIINENWGVDLVHDKRHRAWLRRTFDWLKGYDPSRLVVDNSPLYPSFHLKTDIADYHFYAAIPDSRKAWNSFVDDLAARGRARPAASIPRIKIIFLERARRVGA